MNGVVKPLFYYLFLFWSVAFEYRNIEFVEFPFFPDGVYVVSKDRQENPGIEELHSKKNQESKRRKGSWIIQPWKTQLFYSLSFIFDNLEI